LATSRLGDIMSITLGGVTGDVDYFLLNESRRRELDLAERSVRPILSKARHLCSAQIDRSVWESLRKRDERVWLFDPPDECLRIAAVRRYLELDEACGGCHQTRYKIMNRSPWYRVPVPQKIHGFISGMSKLGPWVCLNRARKLVASNTLYTVAFKHDTDIEKRSAWGLALLSSSARAALARAGRVYPDGLVKHEPGDLSNIRIPKPSRTRDSERVYKRAVEAMLNGKPELASRMADDWL
jgi:adenine-specific DNA-methyltransferase